MFKELKASAKDLGLILEDITSLIHSHRMLLSSYTSEFFTKHLWRIVPRMLQQELEYLSEDEVIELPLLLMCTIQHSEHESHVHKCYKEPLLEKLSEYIGLPKWRLFEVYKK